MLFGISDSTLERYFQEFLDIVSPLAIDNFNSYFNNRFDNSNKVELMYHSNHMIATMVVDGSEQQISIPSDKYIRNSLYSGKKCGKNKKYNKQQGKIQKSIRIIIENVFARIKRFSITSKTLRYKFKQGTFHIEHVLKRHHMVWCTVAF
ncbi:hypothetical protein DICPUDRAFT_83256 [Dictyostelium purpureum]|uniref:DDE Tnp4 domain-containing protein n=1 Tax=Dictyostelium purpureum TaxID=5786 RepID=F0ZZ07_DICPU|nr:uncharacterized protein DICPUDRAFT_83256 [Dictyostelium purpureum]EGC30837.1 hypothetical protein DICPUDRAFT_83256 [Dictyostelium purpureum]|eukprot:XP_003292651.1 hypothetical protein DICPUDRAFT_83256 [Dictyostelium purpureum]